MGLFVREELLKVPARCFELVFLRPNMVMTFSTLSMDIPVTGKI